MKFTEWKTKREPPKKIEVAKLNGTEIVHCFHKYGAFSEVSDEESQAALEEIKLRADIFLESLG